MKKHLLLPLAMAGCATPYQASGFNGGYTDYPAGRGVHYVSFSGNGYTSKESVTAMWHRRAAELCGGSDKYEIVARDGSTEQSYYVANGTLNSVSRSDAEGYIRCVDIEEREQARAPSTRPNARRLLGSTPRGFYCASELCARQRTSCEQYRIAAGDERTCSLTESAFCFTANEGASCSASLESCQRQFEFAGDDVRSECSKQD